MLRQGLALTWCLAAVGATGRVVVPILLQQAIDKGIVGDGRRARRLRRRARRDRRRRARRSPAIAQRTAVVRLGRRSEQALYDLRARLIAHIHRISLADHNEERRGALVARVTSDIETLAQFFQWGGLAWLLDGPLMLMVAAVMLAYDWILALVAFAVAAPLAIVLRVVQRHLVAAYDAGPRAQRRDAGRRSPRSSPAPRRSGPTTPGRRSAAEADEAIDRAQPAPRSGPTSSAPSCSRRARCSRC